MKDVNYVKTLKEDFTFVFDSPQGKNVMAFLDSIGHWTPTVFDSSETNEIIARDANRKLLGTIKTILNCSPMQIMELAE